jgi:hypothetical protein
MWDGDEMGKFCARCTYDAHEYPTVPEVTKYYRLSTHGEGNAAPNAGDSADDD